MRNVIHRMWRWLGVLGALTTVGGPIAAQTLRTIEVSSTPACRGCSIELTRIASLGRVTDAELLGPHSYDVATVGRGGYVAAASTLDRLLVYDSAGTLIRTVGRRGQGPGEFTVIRNIRVGNGDTVYVADGGQPVRVLSPVLEHRRSMPSARALDAPGALQRTAFLRTGEILVQTTPNTIQVLRADGATVRSLAIPVTGGDRPCAGCERRWLAPAREAGRFWSTVSNRYEIDQFDLQGRHHLRLVRRASWFEPWRALTGDRPTPYARAIREDSEGLLWVQTIVPDPAPRPLSPAESTRVLYPAMLGRLWDGVLEVIDPRSGALLASRRLPEYFDFVGGDLLVTSNEDADGIVTMHVWRAAFRRP